MSILIEQLKSLAWARAFTSNALAKARLMPPMIG